MDQKIAEALAHEESRIVNGELHFTYHTLGSIARAGGCKQVKRIDEIPTSPHWMIMEPQGFEKPEWTVWVFGDEEVWLRTMQMFYADKAKGGHTPMSLAAIDCGGKLQARVNISLVSEPRLTKDRSGG